MKQLHGAASTEVNAPIEQCFAMLAAIDLYPSWYPEVVREMDVLETAAGGAATRVRTTLRLSHGPLVKDFTLQLAVRLQSHALVELTRISHGPGDSEEFEVAWRLEDRGHTHIELALNATVAVPRLVPLGSVGDSFAEGFVSAAARRIQSAS